VIYLRRLRTQGDSRGLRIGNFTRGDRLILGRIDVTASSIAEDRGSIVAVSENRRLRSTWLARAE